VKPRSITEPFGVPTHPRATRELAARQRHELAILRALDARPERPALGVCLGMQYMALAAGGRLDQHMPETTPTHASHMDNALHQVVLEIDGCPALGPGARTGQALGEVTSWHRQAVADAGSLRVVARAPDGVIEAIDDPARPFYLGVQWHPERSDDGTLGVGLYRRVVEAASAQRATLA